MMDPANLIGIINEHSQCIRQRFSCDLQMKTVQLTMNDESSMSWSLFEFLKFELLKAIRTNGLLFNLRFNAPLLALTLITRSRCGHFPASQISDDQ